MGFTATVITTSQWGARPPKNGPFALTSPKYIIIHHTDSKNPPNAPSQGTREGAMAFARVIQKDHFSRKWFDSGHNFLNTTGGFVLEGRTGTVAAVKQGKCIQSAHAAQDAGLLPKGNESPGIENEGNFMSFQMSDPQWASLVTLCSELCTALALEPSTIRGHRDFSNTDCPGDWLYGQLPRLRQEVAAKLGVAMTPAEAFETEATKAIKFGDVGPRVLNLQRLLLGSGNSPGALDGIFGENTREAVFSFQKAHGLKASGTADGATRVALGLK